MPPWVVQVRPTRKPSTEAPMTTFPLWTLVWGHWSITAVVIVSTMVNCESRPRVINIVKNRNAQMGGSGI